MADSDNRKELGERAMPPDLDATRLGSPSGVNQDLAGQTWEDYPTAMSPPAAMSPSYSAPSYPEPPRQPVMSPPPGAYSPFPGYSSPAAQSVPPSMPSPESPPRNWGIIGVSVLLVVALIALAIGATWLFTSKGEAKEGEAASQSQSESTQTNTVLETTVTATQAPRGAPNRAPAQSGKSIPVNAVYEGEGFYTPTNNIACLMSSSGVHCQIGVRQWQLGCESMWGVQLDASGVTEQCEYSFGPDLQRQATYGTIYYNGDFACEVGKHTGVNCWNSRTGRGFTMRKADHTTY
ncbi:hypothetical protein [uncultured Varibaculum sp.]|uniref:hypothetical protein n=1 Tax=uncultured Varibaculum sp. TaxID=413896 RepID=UPI002804B7FF|nr:hypothetical protein [uncultured Varibaculum sp.]